MDSDRKTEKKSNPRQHANILSAVTFWWMLPIFYTGYKRDLEVTDLFETLNDHKSDKMGNKLEKMWEKELILAKKSKRTPNLLRTILKVYGIYIAGFGCIAAFLELVVKMVQPIALGKIVMFYSTDINDRDINEAYIYAAVLIISNFITVFIFHPYLMGIFHIAMKLNISMCSLMYRKALRLSKKSLGTTTVGQIVNLMSNDVSRMNGACLFVHDLWIGPLAAIIVTVIMYQEIGIFAIVGTLYIICYIPFQSWLGKKISVLRLRTALRTDDRLRLMNEIINGIQVIKMYTWEKPFATLVSLARRKEIKHIRSSAYIEGINMAIMMFTTRTAIFLTILAYVLGDNDITAGQVFVVTACLNILKNTMTDFFPYAIAQVAQAYISVKRINNFLLNDELINSNNIIDNCNSIIKDDNDDVDDDNDNNDMRNNKEEKNQNGFVIENLEPNHILYTEITDNCNNDRSMNGSILLNNITTKWNNELNENTLTDISFHVAPGKLVTIIGSVGSGKTSLLHTILNELPLTGGRIQVNGTVSYASQEPWLFAGSIRQNILFGEQMNETLYQKVIHCCALKRDFQLLPYGDRTIVGERGISLSGGQKARINLARAVYKNADIYLLDDPLSAVDTHVGKQLFDTCINGLLKEKTVILITHQLQYLKEVDQIIILNNGIKEAEGSYNQLKQSGLDFAKLLEAYNPHPDQQDNNSTIDASENSKLTLKKSLSHVDNKISTENNDDPDEIKELKSIGNIKGEVYRAYLNAAGHKLSLFIVLLFFTLSQLFASAADYFVSFWVNLEETNNKLKNNTVIINDDNNNNNNDFWNFSRETCIYIYTGLIITVILITLWRSFIFYNSCMRASITLHDNMFNGIVRATMRFFNTNTSGRILNRFSKDMGNIDEQLPHVLIDVLQIGLSLLGIIVIIGIVNPWLMIPTCIILILFYLLRIIFLSTSRNIKRLEGVTSSPMFGHLAASLQGLTTIRAFSAQEILQNEFDTHQDLHSTAWYLFLAASRTFALWLDTICTVYISIVTISFFITGTEQHGGNVGLAITQVMSMLGMIQWGIRQSSELENHMTSVERVNEYSKLVQERPLLSAPDKKPPDNWPTDGRLTFSHVYLNYVDNEPSVLKNLSFHIESCEKIGIVGRTGAGKSSLISALFQLAETRGSIVIDRIDITQLGLHDVRSKISIIPQEPVLFSGTMRKNLDPFNEFSDPVLWQALEEVELKQAVSELPGGLNSKMSEGGSNFSVGQRQLVCLARAIIRNNKILVLDEATANVDPKTDSLIQQKIREKFANCTVLTIAHRLNTVMDSDKVLVMDAGTIVEFDHPHMLLQNQNGQLYQMIERTGYTMSTTLKTIAQQNYSKRTKNKDVL